MVAYHRGQRWLPSGCGGIGGGESGPMRRCRGIRRRTKAPTLLRRWRRVGSGWCVGQGLTPNPLRGGVEIDALQPRRPRRRRGAACPPAPPHRARRSAGAARRADAGREKQSGRLGLTVEVDASGGDVSSERARDESSHTETVQGSIDPHQGQHASVPQQ